MEVLWIVLRWDQSPPTSHWVLLCNSVLKVTSSALFLIAFVFSPQNSVRRDPLIFCPAHSDREGLFWDTQNRVFSLGRRRNGFPVGTFPVRGLVYYNKFDRRSCDTFRIQPIRTPSDLSSTTRERESGRHRTKRHDLPQGLFAEKGRLLN